MPDDLLAFLAARLDEAEATARKVSTHLSSAHYEPFVTIDVRHRSGDVTTVEHVRVYEPAAALADVEAKRALIDAIRSLRYDVDEEPDDAWTPDDETEALRILAFGYRHHPSYRAEWAPEATT